MNRHRAIIIYFMVSNDIGVIDTSNINRLTSRDTSILTSFTNENIKLIKVSELKL